MLAVVASDQRSRIRRLDALIERLLARLERLEQTGEQPKRASALSAPPPVIVAPPPPPPIVTAGPARVTGTPPPPGERVMERPPATPVLPKFELPKISFSFEELVGGKLPIWVGGIALVLAAVFLVRYSVEQGLLGPAARTVIAGLFGLALIAASEAAKRIARFAEDPRLAQALAGAGIASLYGTLYMAGELYTLIAPGTTIATMAIVTAGALFLSLRHGPPTAVMGLVGGFTAPFLAAPTGSLVPLLVYLALLIAGLFVIAIQRGWLWLALAATGGGIAWSLGIMVAGVAGIGPSLGIFIVAVAIGATMFIPRTGNTDPRLRLLPIAAGFIQLAIFAPQIDFGYAGWGLYALLSAAALALGYRDARLMPANFAALGLVLVLLIGAYLQDKPVAPWAAIGATLLFAVPGHIFAWRLGTDRAWTILAIGGGIGPLLASYFGGGEPLLGDNSWGGLFALSALPLAALSWRARGEGSEGWRADWALAGGAVAAAAMLCGAAVLWTQLLWVGPAMLAVGVALGGWARQTRDRTLFAASLALAAIVGLIWWLPQLATHIGYIESIMSDAPAPLLEIVAALGLVPAALLAGLAALHGERRTSQPPRWAALALFAMAILSLLPFAWQPAGLAAIAGVAMLAGGRIGLPRFGIEALLAATGLLLLDPLLPFLRIFAGSLIGERLHYVQLPELVDTAKTLLLPGLALAAAGWLARDHLASVTRQFLRGGVALLAGCILYALAKQPLAIASDVRFVDWGFIERAVITQLVFGLSIALLWKGPPEFRRAASVLFATALARVTWFDGIILNPLLVRQNVGAFAVLNAAVAHFALTSFWLWQFAKLQENEHNRLIGQIASLLAMAVTLAAGVRQAFHGAFLDHPGIFTGENYAYSAGFLLLALFWLWRGIAGGLRWLRLVGLLLLAAVSVKVFLIDAAVLEGLLRVFSFLGLGLSLMGIGWVYGRLLGRESRAGNA